MEFWILSRDLLCISQVDKDFIPGLMYIRDNEATAEEFEAMTLPFTVPNASGQDIQLSSKYSHITLENRAEYVRLAINYRWRNQPNEENLHGPRCVCVNFSVFLSSTLQAPWVWWAGLCRAWGDGSSSSSSLAVALHWLRTGNYGQWERVISLRHCPCPQVSGWFDSKRFPSSGVRKPGHPSPPAEVGGHLQRSGADVSAHPVVLGGDGVLLQHGEVAFPEVRLGSHTPASHHRWLPWAGFCCAGKKSDCRSWKVIEST